MFDTLALVFNFTHTELSIHLTVLATNIFLLLFTSKLFTFFNHEKKVFFSLSLFRFVNVSFLILHITDLVFIFLGLHFEYFFLRIALSLLTLYVSLFLFHTLSFFSRKKFGVIKELDSTHYYSDSYSSRIFDILGLIFITILALYTIINIWEWTSLLETTGIFGLLAAFLALTNQIWAPDLYYGLVILNSKLIEDGDVITLNDNSDEYIINKVTFIYTTLLDIRNNHRTLIKNAKLIDTKIDNLSKRASTDGLRFKLSYKIGYASDDSDPQEYHQQIKELFKEVQKEAIEADLHINKHIDFELFLQNTGDYALDYDLYFHLNSLPNTKVTKTIRAALIRTPLLINELVLMLSYKHKIKLSTPFLIKNVSS